MSDELVAGEVQDFYIADTVILSFSHVPPYQDFHQSPHGSSGDPSVATGQAQDMPRTASKREVRNVKDPPVRHFGTIFFNDNDIYVGEYILGKRHVRLRHFLVFWILRFL